ncbi:uncharacterized protein KRP23_1726 [Phytophthora ramorum]|uniref:uncharacterized protein n=1 Tax=Phytophthora ramorum TaxID=164328 RepID=UPI0030A8EDA0|nr:hypothetical protein KRP23_1726 [Phytophthora ramorum]
MILSFLNCFLPTHPQVWNNLVSERGHSEICHRHHQSNPDRIQENMRLSWVVLAAATVLASFDPAFAIQNTDRIKLRGAAVSLTETSTNNRFLRAPRSVDDAGSNDNGDFDEERGRLTLQDAEKMLERMQNFGKAHLGVETGLSKLSREQVKLWFAKSQQSVLFRQVYHDGMDPARLSKLIGLDDIVKKVPSAKLMENTDYVLYTQFTNFWLKERAKAKNLLPPVPLV